MRDVFVRDRVEGITERVSVTRTGGQAQPQYFAGGEDRRGSVDAVMSDDGRYVAFSTTTSIINDIPGAEYNDAFQAVLHDRWTGTNELIAVTSSGASVSRNGDSFAQAIVGDGRFVVFRSNATNIVPGDSNNVEDVFVRDRVEGITERVSVASNGAEANNTSSGGTASAEGHFVSFYSEATNLVPSDSNDVADVFVRDLWTGVTERVSVASDGTQGNGASTRGSISTDGRFVVFGADATNLVQNDTNATSDVFVHDRDTGITERVSVASDGTQGNNGSSGGIIRDFGSNYTVVLFSSNATNLDPWDTNEVQDVFVRYRLPLE
jgi:hypothetical protein